MNEELQTSSETEEKEIITPEVDNQTETEQTPVEATPVVEEQPQQEAIDYKQKFVESSREAMLQLERLKQKDAQLNQLTNKDTPDDEMRSVYSNWDELDDTSKGFYRNQRAMEKDLAHQRQVTSTLAEKLELESKIEDFTEYPPDEFKGIKGKESEFKKFAKKKDNVGLPINVLAKAFLYDVEDKPHTPTRTPGLEQGTGGPRQAPNTKVSIEAAAEIRKTDYKRFMELVKSGQIDDEI